MYYFILSCIELYHITLYHIVTFVDIPFASICGCQTLKLRFGGLTLTETFSQSILVMFLSFSPLIRGLRFTVDSTYFTCRSQHFFHIHHSESRWLASTPNKRWRLVQGAMSFTKTTGSGERHRSFPGGINGCFQK